MIFSCRSRESTQSYGTRQYPGPPTEGNRQRDNTSTHVYIPSIPSIILFVFDVIPEEFWTGFFATYYIVNI
jgi:hypothetical protein